MWGCVCYTCKKCLESIPDDEHKKPPLKETNFALQFSFIATKQKTNERFACLHTCEGQHWNGHKLKLQFIYQFAIYAVLSLLRARTIARNKLLLNINTNCGCFTK